MKGLFQDRNQLKIKDKKKNEDCICCGKIIQREKIYLKLFFFLAGF